MDEKIFLIKNPRVVFIYRLLTLVTIAFGLVVWFSIYGVELEMVYFTNQSNLAVLILFLVLVIGDIYNYKNKKSDNFNVVPIIEMALMVYISITFLGYWGLLSWQNFDMTGGVESTSLRMFLSSCGNYIVHGISPLLVIVHWVLFSPHTRQGYKKAFYFLIYPILYLVFVLIRANVGGPLYSDTYYPYPFIDLNVLGAGNFLLIIMGLLLFFTAWGVFFLYINNSINARLNYNKSNGVGKNS